MGRLLGDGYFRTHRRHNMERSKYPSNDWLGTCQLSPALLTRKDLVFAEVQQLWLKKFAWSVGAKSGDYGGWQKATHPGCDPIQWLTIEISRDGATIWKRFPTNNFFDILLDVQYYLRRIKSSLQCCYTCLANAQPLVPERMINIQHPLYIASHEIAEPFVVAVTGD